jgi:hypothetical protein
VEGSLGVSFADGFWTHDIAASSDAFHVGVPGEPVAFLTAGMHLREAGRLAGRTAEILEEIKPSECSIRVQK